MNVAHYAVRTPKGRIVAQRVARCFAPKGIVLHDTRREAVAYGYRVLAPRQPIKQIPYTPTKVVPPPHQCCTMLQPCGVCLLVQLTLV
jgi:hypothetical protein